MNKYRYTDIKWCFSTNGAICVSSVGTCLVGLYCYLVIIQVTGDFYDFFIRS